MADINDQGELQESQPAPETQEAPAPVEPAPEAEAPPEFIPYRSKDGNEIPLPASALQAIADLVPEAGGNAAAIINKLRMADEADSILRQAKDLYRKARQPRTDAEYQADYQRQQYQQQSYPQRPQYQPPQADPEDPIQLLRETAQRTAAMQAQWEQFVQAQAMQAEQVRSAQEEQVLEEANREYESFVSELKKKGFPDWKIPDRDELLEDVVNTFNQRTIQKSPVVDLFRRVHQLNNPDEYLRLSINEQAARQRDPKAKVPVPAARPSAPVPQAGPQPGVGQLTDQQVLAMLKESARRIV